MDRPTLGSRRRIAVLSDIHANAPAYESALRMARDRGFDELVILGDLLTYGVDPVRVLELTDEAFRRHETVLIRGNHDQLYVDLGRGDTRYYDGLPDWIRESVDWTAERVDTALLADRYPWADDHVIGNVLFSHANPFGPGDWAYLNGDDDLVRAANSLRDAGYAMGVFGHTHRAKIVTVTAGHVARAGSLGAAVDLPIGVVDPGSVGQPRDPRKQSTFAMLTESAGSLHVEILEVEYDLEEYGQRVRGSGMGHHATEKLIGYLR